MKKTLSFITCAFLIAGLFSACASSNEAENSNNKSSAENLSLKTVIDSHYSSMDESVIRAFEKLCDAVLDYQSEVKFNTALTDDVNTLFYTCFPQYVLVEGIDFLEDSSGVSVKYKYDEETHRQKLSEFEDAVTSIMSECGCTTAKNSEYLLNVYSYISKNFKPDSSVTSVFEAATSKSGISSAVNGLFEYILLQNDISASRLMNLAASSTALTIISAEFNGKTYYFDPASEYDQSGGEALVYFAMNDDRAKSSSSNKLTYSDNTEAEEISDDAFAKLANSQSYEITSGKVKVSLKGSDSFEFELE